MSANQDGQSEIPCMTLFASNFCRADMIPLAPCSESLTKLNWLVVIEVTIHGGELIDVSNTALGQLCDQERIDRPVIQNYVRIMNRTNDACSQPPTLKYGDEPELVLSLLLSDGN